MDHPQPLRTASHNCPECGSPVIMSGPRKLFCSNKCRLAHHDRDKTRGRQLVGWAMAARATRDGTRGDKATGEQAAHFARTLMQEWADEDAKAGRMNAVEFAALRIALGHYQ